MAVDFSKSKTRENLMRAFAGESQARNRYTIAANQAMKDNLYSIGQIFLFTADQERAHAEVFYELLRSQSGQNIEICGGYPVDLAENVTDLLKSALHNEMQEFEDVYPEFEKVAREEGFDQVAGAFSAKTFSPHVGGFGARHTTLVNLLQAWKALIPRLVTLAGIVTLVIVLQKAKAPVPMPVISFGITVLAQPSFSVLVAVSIIALQLLRLSYTLLFSSTTILVIPRPHTKTELCGQCGVSDHAPAFQEL